MLSQHIEKYANKKQEEMELFVKAKAGDKAAIREIQRRYSQRVPALAKQNGIDISVANMLSHGAIMDTINEYDETRGAAPFTHFNNTMKNALRNHLETVGTGDLVRTSGGDFWKSTHVFKARENLINSGVPNPTPEQIHEEIRRTRDPKEVSSIPKVNDINRIIQKQRTELSGNVTLGEDGKGENIQMQDIMNVDKATPEDYMADMDAEDRLGKLLSTLDPEDRDIYEEYSSVGKFKGVPAPKKQDMAAKYGFKTTHFFEKRIKEIENNLSKGLMPDGQK